MFSRFCVREPWSMEEIGRLFPMWALTGWCVDVTCQPGAGSRVCVKAPCGAWHRAGHLGFRRGGRRPCWKHVSEGGGRRRGLPQWACRAGRHRCPIAPDPEVRPHYSSWVDGVTGPSPFGPVVPGFLLPSSPGPGCGQWPEAQACIFRVSLHSRLKHLPSSPRRPG